MKIIVGSMALYVQGMCNRIPNDIDMWTDTPLQLSGTAFRIEAHVIPKHILELIPTFDGYATTDAMYTIKCSHAAWDIKWRKTVQDISYLKSSGCVLLPQLYRELNNYWRAVHGDKSFLSLNKSKKDFFNDYVAHTYEHDWLHEVVAYPNAPMYTKVLKDNEEVLIDKVKFVQLSHAEQVKLFREEIYVIALERYLIPSQLKLGIYEAYLRALKKTITNLTKNWASLFIIENYREFNILNSKDWLYNFINFSGEIMPNKMTDEFNSWFADIKVKAEELELGDYDAEEFLLCGYGSEGDRFYDYLVEKYKFKHLTQAGGGEGGAEACSAVIELNGQAFMIEYSYQSYDGYNVDDIYGDWYPVTPVQKEITVYK